MLIGAWALSVWGTLRATNDVGFLVLVDEEEVSRLRDRVSDAGFELDETWLKWNPMLRDVQLRFQFHGITVDLLRPRDVHDQQVFHFTTFFLFKLRRPFKHRKRLSGWFGTTGTS